MKVNGHIISFLMLIAIMVLSSCSKNDSTPVNQTQQQIINIVQAGKNWRITRFIDSGNDETSHFSGYSFVFNANGALSADNGAML